MEAIGIIISLAIVAWIVWSSYNMLKFHYQKDEQEFMIDTQNNIIHRIDCDVVKSINKKYLKTATFWEVAIYKSKNVEYTKRCKKCMYTKN